MSSSPRKSDHDSTSISDGDIGNISDNHSTNIPGNDSTNIKNAGLKVTLPRLKILDILAQPGQKHFSAEAVHKALQD